MPDDDNDFLKRWELLIAARPDRDPIGLMAEMMAAELESFAAETHAAGLTGVAAKLDLRSAEMDKLAAARRKPK